VLFRSAWSRQPGCDEVCMAWSWMQRSRTTVDFFRFERDTSLATVDPRLVFELERAAADRSPRGDYVRVMPSPPDLLTNVRTRQGGPDDVDPTGRARERFAKERLIRRTIEDREDQLAETVTPQRVPGLGAQWRGEWQTVSSPTGAAAARLLLAVDADGRGTRLQEATRLDLAVGSQLEVAVDGRVLVAVDWRTREPEEVGRQLREVLAHAD